MKAYAFSISTDEVFYSIDTDKGNELLNQMKKCQLIGIWQEPNGLFQAFLFRTPEERNAAYTEACFIGYETAAVMIETAEIDDCWLNHDKS